MANSVVVMMIAFVPKPKRTISTGPRRSEADLGRHSPKAAAIHRAAGFLPIKVVIPDEFPGVKANVVDIPAFEVDLAPYYAITPDPETEPLQIPEVSDENSVPGIPPVRAEEFYADAYCQRPFTEVMIRDQREVLPCPWHQKVLGHLDQGNDLEQIFFGENFAALRASMISRRALANEQDCKQNSQH